MMGCPYSVPRARLLSPCSKSPTACSRSEGTDSERGASASLLPLNYFLRTAPFSSLLHRPKNEPLLQMFLAEQRDGSAVGKRTRLPGCLGGLG